MSCASWLCSCTIILYQKNKLISLYFFFVVHSIEGCYNYTTHNDNWRNVNSNMVVQPNTTSCDHKNLMTPGWHRFVGASGTRLHTKCPDSGNKCGTTSPGWVVGEHPVAVGETTKNTLYFHTFYCADDFGSVEIKNCGNFFSYRFTNIPVWSCDYGICTV